jgi:hypothetical protein
MGPTTELAHRLLFAALSALKDNGGTLAVRDLLAEIEKRITLDAWASSPLPKTGYIRWQ